MLKKIFMIAALVLMTGLALAYEPKYDISYVNVRIGHGDSFWNVAEEYFPENEFSKIKAMCMDEYVWNIKHDPRNAKLTANNRVLQPGDVIAVPVFKLVKE